MRGSLCVLKNIVFVSKRTGHICAKYPRLRVTGQKKEKKLTEFEGNMFHPENPNSPMVPRTIFCV